MLFDLFYFSCDRKDDHLPHGRILQDVGSIGAAPARPQRHGECAVRSTPLVSYEVHEFQGSCGLTVREYVASTGTVFALSWSGAVAPVLQQLLGQLFPSYAAAVAGLRHAGLQRAMRVAAGELVVE